MVSGLSKTAKAAVQAAIDDAETRTTAEIALVVTPSSDPYQSFLALHAFALGSLAAMALWLCYPALGFPVFFILQVAVLVTVFALSPLHPLFMKLVPKKVMHHRVARRAYEEFLIASRHMPAPVPVVLLFVSLAEKYVHVVHSRAVPQKIAAAEWDKIIANFTAAMPQKGVDAACLAAVADMARLLEAHFPEPK